MSIRSLFRVGILLGAIIFTSPAAPVHAATCAAQGFINTVSKKMLSAGKSRSTGAFRSLLNSHADVSAISSFPLGKYNRSVNPTNRRALQKGIVNFMAKTMAQYGRKFKGNRVAISRCSKSGKFLTVNSKLVQANRRTQKFVWKLVGDGKYKIRDLNVQGIWLGQLMRTSFTKIIKKGGGNVTALYAHLGVHEKLIDRK
jgi:phospholipid transport system substrate-binding protein